jgi:hypothetical protein
VDAGRPTGAGGPLRALLADVAGIGPFFAVVTVTVPPDGGWVPVRALWDDPDVLPARVSAVRTALGTSERVAASVAVQGVAAQIVAPLFAAAVVGGGLPVPDSAEPPCDAAAVAAALAGALHWRAGGAGPWLCWPGAVGRVVPGSGAPAFEDVVVGLLRPLVDEVRARVPVAARVLWGNAASAVASARALVAAARPLTAERATDVAERLLCTPPLAATAALRAPEPPDVRWTFRRRSCCLYYRVPGGGVCGDCVLRDRPCRG